jgi:hypothetical protein
MRTIVEYLTKSVDGGGVQPVKRLGLGPAHPCVIGGVTRSLPGRWVTRVPAKALKELRSPSGDVTRKEPTLVCLASLRSWQGVRAFLIESGALFKRGSTAFDDYGVMVCPTGVVRQAIAPAALARAAGGSNITAHLVLAKEAEAIAEGLENFVSAAGQAGAQMARKVKVLVLGETETELLVARLILPDEQGPAVAARAKMIQLAPGLYVRGDIGWAPRSHITCVRSRVTSRHQFPPN